MNIIQEVQKLVADSGIHYTTLAKATQVSPRWVYRFMNNEYRDVGALRLQRMRVYLLDQREVLV